MKSSFEPVPLTAPEPFVPLDALEPELTCEPTSVEVSPEAWVNAPEPEVLAPDPGPVIAAVEALEQGLAALGETRREESRRYLWGALDVAVALAERILERELSLHPSSLHPLVERAIERLDQPDTVEIALAPDALALADEVADADLSPLETRHGVKFVADPELMCGEARVVAGPSSVDLRLQSLLSMLREELVPDWEQETR